VLPLLSQNVLAKLMMNYGLCELVGVAHEHHEQFRRKALSCAPRYLYISYSNTAPESLSRSWVPLGLPLGTCLLLADASL
jgi:hypothetical protein